MNYANFQGFAKTVFSNTWFEYATIIVVLVIVIAHLRGFVERVA